jgi:hypothetical protein
MKTIDICKGAIIVQVVQERSGLKLVVKTSGSDASEASFPTDLTLLAGVTRGYSYQVASPTGSLTISADDSLVSLQFDKGKGATKCRIEREGYEAAIRDLQPA